MFICLFSHSNHHIVITLLKWFNFNINLLTRVIVSFLISILSQSKFLWQTYARLQQVRSMSFKRNTFQSCSTCSFLRLVTNCLIWNRIYFIYTHITSKYISKRIRLVRVPIYMTRGLNKLSGVFTRNARKNVKAREPYHFCVHTYIIKCKKWKCFNMLLLLRK